MVSLTNCDFVKLTQIDYTVGLSALFSHHVHPAAPGGGGVRRNSLYHSQSDILLEFFLHLL